MIETMSLLQENPSANKVMLLSIWKPYHSIEKIKDFVSRLLQHPHFGPHLCLVAVPFVYLKELSTTFVNASLKWGANRMPNTLPESFTGSVAGQVIKEEGASFVLLGSRKSRQHLHETDEEINDKIKQLISLEITPILCVGETLEQSGKHQTEDVLKLQCQEALKNISPEDLSKIILFYENPALEFSEAKWSTDRYAESCLIYRQALSEVVGTESFKGMHFIDSLSEDSVDLSTLLYTVRSMGFYVEPSDLLTKVLDVKKNWDTYFVAPVKFDFSAAVPSEEFEEPQNGAKGYSPE